MEFQWDAGNIRHLLHDHPERKFTVEEVESLWEGPYRLIESANREVEMEPEYQCLAKSNRNRLLLVFRLRQNAPPVGAFPFPQRDHQSENTKKARQSGGLFSLRSAGKPEADGLLLLLPHTTTFTIRPGTTMIFFAALPSA